MRIVKRYDMKLSSKNEIENKNRYVSKTESSNFHSEPNLWNILWLKLSKMSITLYEYIFLSVFDLSLFVYK